MAKYAPCPKCGMSDAEKVGWTWWGGALGPRLMNHVKCNYCGTTFNGNTGKSNTFRIVTYVLVVAIIVLIVVFMI